MSADLRERVARAIEAAYSDFPRAHPCTIADAVLAELGLAQAEPVGEWVMVPRKPTHAMLKAGVEWGGEAMDYHEAMGRIGAAWGPMLAAAPRPRPQPQASAEDVALVAGAVIAHVARYPGSKAEEALDRLRASLGVSRA